MVCGLRDLNFTYRAWTESFYAQDYAPVNCVRSWYLSLGILSRWLENSDGKLTLRRSVLSRCVLVAIMIFL